MGGKDEGRVRKRDGERGGKERKERKEGVLCVLSVVSYTTHFQEVEHHGEKRLQNQRTQRSVELKYQNHEDCYLYFIQCTEQWRLRERPFHILAHLDMSLQVIIGWKTMDQL